MRPSEASQSSWKPVCGVLIVFVGIAIAGMASVSTVTKCSCSCRANGGAGETGGCATSAGISGEDAAAAARECVMKSYRPHGNLARLLWDKQRADERLEAYDKSRVSDTTSELVRRTYTFLPCAGTLGRHAATDMRRTSHTHTPPRAN